MSPVLQPLRFMENFSFFQLHSFLFYGHGGIVLAQHRFWFQQQSQKSMKTFRFLAKHCNTCLFAFKSTLQHDHVSAAQCSGYNLLASHKHTTAVTQSFYSLNAVYVHSHHLGLLTRRCSDFLSWKSKSSYSSYKY